jgi:hypothetical protein
LDNALKDGKVTDAERKTLSSGGRVALNNLRSDRFCMNHRSNWIMNKLTSMKKANPQAELTSEYKKLQGELMAIVNRAAQSANRHAQSPN